MRREKGDEMKMNENKITSTLPVAHIPDPST